MMNWNLINSAKLIASDYFEMNGISVTNQCLLEKLTDWYNNTEISDDRTLAACVVCYGNWNSIYNYDDILYAKAELDKFEDGFIATAIGHPASEIDIADINLERSEW